MNRTTTLDTSMGRHETNTGFIGVSTGELQGVKLIQTQENLQQKNEQ